MGFSRQENWSGLPCPSPGDLPNPGMEPRPPTSRADSLPAESPAKPHWCGDSTDNERWRETGRVFSRDSCLGPSKRLQTESDAKPHCSGMQGGFFRDVCPHCGGETSHVSSLRLLGRDGAREQGVRGTQRRAEIRLPPAPLHP